MMCVCRCVVGGIWFRVGAVGKSKLSEMASGFLHNALLPVLWTS